MSVDHLDLVVTSLERSLALYRGLLAPLGYVRLSEIAGERGERVRHLGRIGGIGSVSLREAQSDAHGVPYDRCGVGLHDLAFVHRPSERDLAAQVLLLTERLERLERERG